MSSAESGPNDEKPVHQVTISRGYWMRTCEITQAQWGALMGTEPSKFKGDELPVEQVSWHDAVKLCRKLTDRERQAGRLPEEYIYRLPTEAEWEWCLDWYAHDYYSSSPQANSINSDFGDKTYRVCRGGSWGLYPTHCRSANRGGGTPKGRFYSYGFRVVLASATK